VKNTGKPYEVLTEQVFTRLLAQSNVCASVERDVILEGKSTKHQIDVTFEFVAGPTTYRTIVQCKDWASSVKQEQVLAFQAVLTDIAGQPRGIMVSRSGFQEGARCVAEHHGIELYELREPRDEDWNGLIRAFEVTLHLRAPHFDNVRLILDEPWLREEVARRALPGLDLQLRLSPAESPVLFESGEPCDLNRILNGYVPADGPGPLQVRHMLTERAFIEAASAPISRLPVLGLEATITVYDHHRSFRVSLDHLIAYCFRDVLGGTVQFLGVDGAPLRPDEGPA
jgi:hypothetical protein